jgi:hypothetical protein
LLTPSPGSPVRQPDGHCPAISITWRLDHRLRGGIARVRAFALQKKPVEWRISLCHLAADARYLARLK